MSQSDLSLKAICGQPEVRPEMERWETKRKEPHLTWGASYLPVTCQGKGDISQPLIIKKIRGKTNRFFFLIEYIQVFLFSD